MQKKAYRANSESHTVYKEKNSYEVTKLIERKPQTAIHAGKCAQVYGISDFSHISSKTLYVP